MDVFLATLGCRLNEAELERWHRDFSARGHRVVRQAEHAQVLVLNTCAVTAAAARKSRQYAGRMHRKNPGASLVMTGCYAEMDPARVAELAGVDLVVGNHDKDRLVDLVTEHIDPAVMPARALEPDADSSHVYADTRTRAFLKVQDGCRNRCTFCIVTILRGEERSRPVAEVVAEVNRLGAEGYREVVLTGVHLGGYGSDLGSSLFELVQRVLAETDVPRIRLTSLEPWDLPDNFFSLWENPRLQPHLHLPLQSGCDSTLRRMARRCDTSSYRGLVDAARAGIPGLSLTTDLIVGFPGETDAEWRATYAFVESIGFAHMHIFTFSPRQGTKAARVGGQLHGDVKRERSRELHELGVQMKTAHLARFVGTRRPVLWEGHPEPEDGAHVWSGYTDNYLRVRANAPAGVPLQNVIEELTLQAVDDDGFHGLRDSQLRLDPAQSVTK